MTIDLKCQDEFDYVAKGMIDILKVSKVKSYLDYYERANLQGHLLQLMIRYSSKFDTMKWVTPYREYVETRQ